MAIEQARIWRRSRTIQHSAAAIFSTRATSRKLTMTRLAQGPISAAIDNWIEVPFHRLSLLDPQLHRVGYGSHCENDACAAALNVHGDVERRLTRPVPLAAPIK